MSENYSDREFNNERFKRIEETVEKLSALVDKNNINVCIDLEKLKDDLNALKQDYAVTKSGIIKTMKKLEDMPDAINNLEKTLIILSQNIENNDKKTDEIGKNVENLRKKVSENEEKGKFDIISYVKSLIPYIIEAGIIGIIVKLIK